VTFSLTKVESGEMELTLRLANGSVEAAVKTAIQ
jgi:hypothetical protein